MSSTDKTHVADPLIGASLGEYRVLEVMARGGMAVVYRGEQPHIGKKVAIKVLLPEMAADEEMVHRLLEEARAVNAIRHPNLISIYGFGQLPDGRHYYVMEYLPGQTLAELLGQTDRLPIADALLVLEQMCDGLTAAHGAGVVHRDLKPGNVFITDLPDGTRRVKLLDFGIAKRMDSSFKTATNIVLGTPGYMAPEQIRGKTVSAATDLYALGIIAHRMLAGREPFEDGPPFELMQRHLSEAPPLLRSRAPDAPVELEELVTALLEKEPANRPQSASEVRQQLQRMKAKLPRATTIESPRVSIVTPLGAAIVERASPQRHDTTPTRMPEGVMTPISAPAVVRRPVRETAATPAPTRSRAVTVGLVLLGALGGIGGTVLVMQRANPPVAPAPAPPVASPEPAAPPVPAAPEVPKPEVSKIEPVVTAVAPVAPEKELEPRRPLRPRPVAPAGKSREDVRAQLTRLRQSAKALPPGAVHHLIDQELAKLGSRLEAGEKPAQISTEADQLARESGLEH